MSKHLEFKASAMGSTVFNRKSGVELGNIFFYRPWTQYVFEPTMVCAVFNDGCLNEIIQQIKHLKRNKPNGGN